MEMAIVGIMAFSLIGRLLYQPFYEHYLTRTLYSQTSVTFPLSPIEVYYSIGPLRMTSWILATLAVLVCGYSLVKYLIINSAKINGVHFCLWRYHGNYCRICFALCVLFNSLNHDQPVIEDDNYQGNY
ncbi:hypothetical protein IC611_00715 [Proteus mirabilis]